MKTLEILQEKPFTVVIETLVNPFRDADEGRPQIKSYWYDVIAIDERDAKQKAKAIFDNEYPYKGIYDIDAL